MPKFICPHCGVTVSYGCGDTREWAQTIHDRTCPEAKADMDTAVDLNLPQMQTETDETAVNATEIWSFDTTDEIKVEKKPDEEEEDESEPEPRPEKKRQKRGQYKGLKRIREGEEKDFDGDEVEK